MKKSLPFNCKLFSICILFSAVISLPLLFGQTALSFYENGRVLQQEEDYFGALGSYQEALRLNDSYCDVWIAMAECSYALDQYDLCLAYLENAEKYSRNDKSILNLRGFAFIGLGRIADARQVFNDVLAIYPNNIDARFGLAELDLFDGKISSAEKLYTEALKRQTNSRKALLSLALVSHELNKPEAAKKYIEQALTYFSGESEVHYYAAWIHAKEDRLKDAETELRKALKLKPQDQNAYKLLASVLYEGERYAEVNDICDLVISNDRNTTSAWYLKGMSFIHLGNPEEAISAFESGLEIDSQDEVMRSSLELLAFEYTETEDSRRSLWADYHIKRAESFSKKYQLTQARYEYQRALRLDPYDTDIRYAYAANLLLDGYPERYLDQLKFIKSRDAATVTIEDTIDAYESILYNTLPKRWSIDPLLLDKNSWTVSLYYIPASIQPVHAEVERVTAQMVAASFSGVASINVIAQNEGVSGFAEAFRTARIANHDYFCIISVAENEREITVDCSMYSAKNGIKMADFNVYRTGNDRFAGCIRKVRESIISLIPVRGTIVARNGNDVLIDLGRSDGIAKDQVLSVIKSGHLLTADQTMELSYSPSDFLGTVTITTPGEEVSQGTLKLKGFYDLVNTGDEVAIQPAQSATDVVESVDGTQNSESGTDTLTVNEANSTSKSTAKTDTSTTKTITSQISELVQLIRGIR